MAHGNEKESRRLIRRLLEGDENAWSSLIQDYSGLLTGIAIRTFATYGFEATPQDAEDAVAETWRNLLNENGRLVRSCAKRGNLVQTLIVLVRNRAVDIMRHRKGITVEWEDKYGGAGDFAGQDRDRPRPGDALLKEAVMALPERERVLVSLFFLQRRKYREIAEIAGIPQNSIGPTLARALRRLRQAVRAGAER